MKNFFLGILVTVLILSVGVVGYFLGQKKTPSPSNFSDVVSTPTDTALTPTPSISASPTISNDASLIKQSLFQKNGWTDTNEINFTLNTNDGKYASGTVSSQGGGGYFYAIKDNGQWVIVADGNGVIECSKINKYPDFPTYLIPECYNTYTNKSVKR